MKQPILTYVSHHQTQFHPLRQLLIKCERYGLTIERDPHRGTLYKVNGRGESLTDFITLSKLDGWMVGFEQGFKYCKDERHE